MSREDVKKMLGENATDEQVTAVLNSLHAEKAKADALNEQLNSLNNANKESEKKNKELEDRLNAIEMEKMTEAEKFQLEKQALEKEKQEVAKNLANSKKVLSRAKAQEILSQVGITDEEILKTIVSDDLDITIASATILANKFKSVQEETVKKTKEELANLDIKPNPSNIPQGENEGMTLDKFYNMSAAEQEKFINENPKEFENL